MAGLILALASPLLALCAVACPVGMGAMMWFMARGSRSNASPPAQSPATLDDPRHGHERPVAQPESPEGTHADAEASDQPEAALAAGTGDTLQK